MTTGRNLRIGVVRVAVVDVGSNTVRLLVAERSRRGVRAIRSERAHLGLATDVEREGCISDAGLKAVGSFAERYVTLARRLEARTIDVVVTAPGRQSSNPDELLAVLGRTGERARILSAEDEGRLAYSGALCGLAKTPESLAVCDIGGGSTQLMVGTGEGPVWLRSLDIGSLRLTERVAPGDPPDPDELASLTEEARAAFDAVTPPLAPIVLATGGTARAVRRLVGRRLGERQLARVLRLAAARPSAQLAAEYGLDPQRARTLTAGILILREAQRRFGVDLEVARGGVREGVVVELLQELEAAAA